MAQHLGILGGGQLGRMLALAAHPLGIAVTVLDPSAEAPAAAVSTHLRAPYDSDAALEVLARATWVTFEFENVPDQAASKLEQRTRVAPPPRALRTSQDRWVEKNTFSELGIPTPAYRRVDSMKDAEQALLELGPIVLKTRRFGYDGKGQARATQATDLPRAYESLGGAPAIAEQLIAFDREVSVILCRASNGAHVVYPICENTHENGILRRTVAPAPDFSGSLVTEANHFALRLAEHLNYVGVLALELFVVGESLLANEFAPRVHNSGHWTIEGAITSQFENHVRAVTGLPLGSAELRAPAVMTNLIGHIPDKERLLAIPDTHLHDYGKAARPGRKVGHVTCVGGTARETEQHAALVQALVDARPAG